MFSVFLVLIIVIRVPLEDAAANFAGLYTGSCSGSKEN